MMKLFFVLISCIFPYLVFGKIRINEVMQSNVNGIIDDLNEYPDSWVEIYNGDSVTFDFTGYGIGLTRNFEESFAILPQTSIASKGHLLIYCDKADEGLHTDFRLDVDSSSIYLFDTNGKIVDSLKIPEMLAPDVAYGRVSDGSEQLSFFMKATPGKPNYGFVTDRILKKPKFSIEGGIYHSPVVLRLTLQGEYPADAVIRYTTNGSEPSEYSPIAPDSIVINKTTVIRAKSFSDSALSKISATHTFIISEREYYLPIVSIVTDSINMYGDETGILVEGTYGLTHPEKQSDIPELGCMNYLYSWKRPINFEYFPNPSQGQAVINQLCETEIGGNTSCMFTVKSLNVKANKRFGNNKFSYPFWKDKPNVTKSKTLYLRNSGQDFYSFHFRDAVNQMSFGKYVDLDWEASQPVVVLINGNYYGMVNLREKVDDNYIWSNYDKLENIDMVYENNYRVKKGDLEEYARYHILLDDKNAPLSKYDSLIDLNEFMNYFVLNMFYCNKDFPGNNQILWRERIGNAKWRYIAKDMDVTANLMMNSAFDYPYLNYILRKEPFLEDGRNYERGCKVFMRTMEFPEIANQVIDRTCIYMGTFVSARRSAERVDSIASIMEPEIPYFYDRIDRSIEDWRTVLGWYKDWINERIPYLYNHLSEFFNLGDTVSVTIKADKSSPLYFNGVKVEGNNFDGKYFYNRPLYLSRNESAFSYKGDSINIVMEDSLEMNTSKGWVVSYNLNGKSIKKRFSGNSLYFLIPEDATNVTIVDSACNLPELSIYTSQDECEVSSDVLLKYAPTSIDENGELKQMMLKEKKSFEVGYHTVYWCLDSYKDSFMCSQNVFVIDTFAPVLHNCGDMDSLVIYIHADSFPIDNNVLRKYAPVANDNCSLVLGELADSVDICDYGNFNLNWHFVDASQNELFCLQNLYVHNYSFFEGCKNDFFVGPNPMNDFLIVKGIEQNKDVDFFDVSGRLVLKVNVGPYNSIRIDVSDLESGLYFVKSCRQIYKIVKM